MLADARATTVYAAASLTAMLTEGCCPAYLAEFALPVVLADGQCGLDIDAILVLTLGALSLHPVVLAHLFAGPCTEHRTAHIHTSAHTNTQTQT